MGRLARLLVGALLFCSCATGSNFNPGQSEDVRAMMESTVRIQVDIQQVVTRTDEDTGEVSHSNDSTGWSGSGVVYAKTNGILSAVHSRILTANHVLELPKVGDVEGDQDNNVKVTDVKVSIRTFDGRVCSLEPLALGENTTEDVATGEADCDAGKVAPIAHKVPGRAEHVYISGHSLGVELTMVTEGYVSGWMGGGFLLVSAPAAPGNSGGPVFYHGEVIGLLVRGAPRYPHLSLVTPLKPVLQRIAATKPL
jgi:S1-C subfamily serine protease